MSKTSTRRQGINMAHKSLNRSKASTFTASAAFPFILAVIFFFIVCMCTISDIKPTALILMILAFCAVIFRFPVFRTRLALPLIALGLFVLMAGISTFYAPAGKFAMSEFLKIAASFSLALLLVSLAPTRGMSPSRWGATILSGGAAVAALVSIDLLSTHTISSVVLWIISLFTEDYTNLSMVEAGVRMTSIFENPNVFAGCAGIGVLLSLGLTQSSKPGKERGVHLCCLFISSFAFVLAFSMGATAAIIVAFLVYLILEKANRRAELLVIMVETLVLAVVGAALVSKTSFQPWTGFDIVPLAFLIVACALICLADKFINRPIAEKLGANRKTVPVLICAVLAVVIIFVLIACFVTGSVQLDAGESLRRAVYPDAGSCTVSADFSGDVTVTVESQNKQETMMHTGTTLYNGVLENASFTVPEDSMVLYLTFQTSNGAVINHVDVGGKAVPLGYKLLPGFVANRLQGLFANENAIQRTVFFADGMKLFARNPIVGLGLGAFENGIQNVQSFHYETKYAHNHYIQVLAETGILGFLLFVGLIVVAATAILRSLKKEDRSPFLPALGAALVFMAIHAFTEVVFSVYCYLPFAFCTFALIALDCPTAFPWPRTDKRRGSKEQLGITAGFALILAVFSVLLICNLSAARLVSRHPTLTSVERAVRMDRYEWADYALSYVVSVGNSNEATPELMEKADAYAERLAKVPSNTIPIYLAQYYFTSGRTQQGIAMIKQYVNYVSSNPSAWQGAFDTLQMYYNGSQEFKVGILEVAQMLKDWNENNMGNITLNAATTAFLKTLSE